MVFLFLITLYCKVIIAHLPATSTCQVWYDLFYYEDMKKGAQKECTTCPIAKASSLIGDMWILLIVRELLTGPKRFSELQQTLISHETSHIINSRTLTLRLKTLEEHAIITRQEFSHKKPPRVEYTLTKEGRALSKLVEEVRAFGKKYL